MVGAEDMEASRMEPSPLSVHGLSMSPTASEVAMGGSEGFCYHTQMGRSQQAEGYSDGKEPLRAISLDVVAA